MGVLMQNSCASNLHPFTSLVQKADAWEQAELCTRTSAYIRSTSLQFHDGLIMSRWRRGYPLSVRLLSFSRGPGSRVTRRLERPSTDPLLMSPSRTLQARSQECPLPLQSPILI
jgi:hypothetical protein